MGTKKADIATRVVKSFPNDIMSEVYEQRRLYISIYKANTVEKIVELLKAAVDTTVAKVEEVVKSKSAGEVVSKGTDYMNTLQKAVKEFNGVEQMVIALPMPNELSDLQRHDFSVETGIAKEIFDKIPGSSLLQKTVSKTAQVGNQQTIIASPGYFQNYTGSKPRDFTFTFNLIPNNKEEADSILDIINNIKRFSSPEDQSGAFLIAPNFFWIRFSNDTLNLLTQIQPCFVTEVKTDYAGSGILETTFDGMPKQIKLEISICEIRALTQSDWTL